MTALPNQKARRVREIPEHVLLRFTEGMIIVDEEWPAPDKVNSDMESKASAHSISPSAKSDSSRHLKRV